MKAEKVDLGETSLLEKQQRWTKRPQRFVHIVIAAVILAALLVKQGSTWTGLQALVHQNPSKHLNKVQQCSIDNFHQDLGFLDHAKPIEAHEFIQRRDRLAQALAQNGVDAFVLEPGYTFQCVLLCIHRHLIVCHS